MTTAPISAAQQFRAIAYLRWRLFANGFRRKGGKGELFAMILGYPFAALLLFSVLGGAFAGAYAAASTRHLELLAGVFWAIFALQVVVSINIAAPGLSFDPASLIRFPLSFPRYLLVRLFLGLLAASNVVGTTAMLAAAAGVTAAVPSLAAPAFAAALILALTAMLFTRMVFAWVDRWLSTRRARELFTAVIILGSLGFQYVNVTFNDFGHHQTHAQRMAKVATLRHAYNFASPILDNLPPALAGRSVVAAAASDPASTILLLLAVLAFAAAFLAVFAWRMHREYRGENLSEVNHAPPPTLAAPVPHSAATPQHSPFSPIFAALLTKEWTYVRRNPAQFYGLLAPLAMVFLFAARIHTAAGGRLIFPAAAAYSILGVSALSYNVLGVDANGIQFYFLSPVSFRSIFLAKNTFSFAITALQLVLLYILMAFTIGAPGLLLTLSVFAWVVFASLVNVTVGNIRSITAPKKIDPAKISRRQASQLSALLALALMLVAIAIGAATIVAAAWFHLAWVPIPVFFALAAGAFAFYWIGLGNVDRLAANNRENLIEQLSKVE